MMVKPDTQAGAYICGSDNITSKLAQGWIIIPSDRNNILPERIAQAIPTPSGMDIDTENLAKIFATGSTTIEYGKGNGRGYTVDYSPSPNKDTDMAKEITIKPKRGRPRKERQ